ncbi:MAG: 3-dehydroquinate synthase [Actinobacteria bacterium]|nr:3-dehydroquinate synthase [Actinomycetota bacterium]MBA3655540.1 3-dehydroquinate synthase [Actinomycetota bacterium]
MIEVTVDLGERSYPILIGAGVRHELAHYLPERTRRVAIITQDGIGWASNIATDVDESIHMIGNGEAAKSLGTVEMLCDEFVSAGLTRSDTVVGVGGGVVTDVAGFAASVYYRGIAVIQIPTTLLGMIDAAIGGKTGVNLTAGKNLVGAFWQPTAVLCDTEALTTLPAREMRSGLGELAKYHFLTGDDLDALPLEKQIAAAAQIKGRAVSADEQEKTGVRAKLNYGHTLAHALETAGRYDLRHGEAVAIGLAYAARLAQMLGRIDDARVAEHVRVLAKHDLPVSIPSSADPDELVRIIRRDKKSTGDGLTFVLDGPRGVELVSEVPEDVVLAAMKQLRG